MTLQSINEKSLDLVKKYKERILQRQLEKSEIQKKEHFLSVLNAAKNNVTLKRNHFNYVTDEKLMECCIFELKAAEARLNYCLLTAKRERLINDDYIDNMLKGNKNERRMVL